jgi:3'-phosphoadenosine 5'-phosphosulfate (PAPS) 3'-phosphatase
MKRKRLDHRSGRHHQLHPRLPQYCVSIALQQRGIITQAVVYDPTRNDLFTASRALAPT